MSIINTTHRKAEILLVEDNPGDILLAVEAFRGATIEHNLHIANDGAEALEILNQIGKYNAHPKPDLIILDLNLPKVDGREVLDKIKNSESLKDIPVIVLSGSDTDTDISTSYDLHANSYLVKPESFTEMQEIITSIENYWFEHSTTTDKSNLLH